MSECDPKWNEVGWWRCIWRFQSKVQGDIFGDCECFTVKWKGKCSGAVEISGGRGWGGVGSVWMGRNWRGRSEAGRINNKLTKLTQKNPFSSQDALPKRPLIAAQDVFHFTAFIRPVCGHAPSSPSPSLPVCLPAWLLIVAKCTDNTSSASVEFWKNSARGPQYSREFPPEKPSYFDAAIRGEFISAKLYK